MQVAVSEETWNNARDVRRSEFFFEKKTIYALNRLKNVTNSCLVIFYCVAEAEINIQLTMFDWKTGQEHKTLVLKFILFFLSSTWVPVMLESPKTGLGWVPVFTSIPSHVRLDSKSLKMDGPSLHATLPLFRNFCSPFVLGLLFFWAGWPWALSQIYKRCC